MCRKLIDIKMKEEKTSARKSSQCKLKQKICAPKILLASIKYQINNKGINFI